MSPWLLSGLPVPTCHEVVTMLVVEKERWNILLVMKEEEIQQEEEEEEEE